MRTLTILIGLSLAACPAADPRPDDVFDGPDQTIAADGALADRGLDATNGDASTRDAALDDAATAVDGALDASAPPDMSAPDAAVPPGCARYTTPMVSGTLTGATLAEVSGVAASRQTPDVLWMHNDSGNDAALYAVSTTGEVRGWISLPDARDLEDVAIARCPAAERWCIWVADIGDNAQARDEVRIFIVPEPPVRDGEIVVDGIATLQRTYADGAHDAEALMVAEDGQRFWIVTKVEGEMTQVFAGTAGAGPRGTLDEIARFNAPGVAVPMGKMVTGADLHPSGERLAIRVYTGSYEYWLGDAGVAALQTATPRQISLGPLAEPQGEAIGYAADGDGLWTISEQPEGGQPLHRYDCAP